MREGFTSLILHNSVTFLRVMAILDRSLYWEVWNYIASVLATHIQNVANGMSIILPSASWFGVYSHTRVSIQSLHQCLKSDYPTS